MKVSQLVDSDKPIIDYLYGAMDRVTMNLSKLFIRDQVRRASSSTSWDLLMIDGTIYSITHFI
jgi:hypothetical protein